MEAIVRVEGNTDPHYCPAKQDLAVKRIAAALAEICATQGNTKRGRRPFPHPFPARMPLEVALTAVQRLAPEKGIVLDPMSGSGVVPRAAQLAGRTAIGLDIDPLAVALGRAMTARISSGEYSEAARRLYIRALARLIDKNFVSSSLEEIPAEDRKFFSYWFPESCISQMLSLSSAHRSTRDAERDALLATISSLVISRGSGASYAMDLSRSRPHKVATKEPKTPFSEFLKKADEFKKFYATFENEKCIAAEISLGDARDTLLDDDSIDTVITSPPYLNAIDYIRTSKFTLTFFGHHLEKLRNIRSTMVGSEVGLDLELLPSSLRDMVQQGVSDPKRRPMVARWVSDMREALAEAYRVTKPGGAALYVVGPSILSRARYDGADVLGEIAKTAGWIIAGKGRRDYSESNRSLPPPRRNQRSQAIHQRMTCEMYVALYKPDRNEIGA